MNIDRKITFYITCYNAEDFIGECLEGIFKQTYPIDEVLVVDDSIEDKTSEIASRFPVRLIRRRARLGLPSGRNAAFREARNEFVAALDVDCIPGPEWLEKIMANFKSDDIAGVGGMAIERHVKTIPDKWRAIHMKSHWGHGRIVNPRLLFGCNTVFKKSAIKKAGFFDEVKYKRCYEDVDMSKRLKAAGYTLIYDPSAKVSHMRKDTFMSVIRTHWIWNFVGIGGIRTPDNLYNLLCKIYDGLILSLRMFADDTRGRRPYFFHIDAAIFFHHIFCDIKYYITTKWKR